MRGILISDFNMSNFGAYLRNDSHSPALEITEAPYGQVYQVLMNRDLDCWAERHDFAIVWIQPERVFPSFQKLLNHEGTSVERTIEEVDEFCKLLNQARESVDIVLVPTLTLPSFYRGLGVLDINFESGVEAALLRMNLRLTENLQPMKNVFLLDSRRWHQVFPGSGFSSKLWYMAKVPFENQVFKNAVKDVKAALNVLGGGARKVLVLDLDNLLWGGVVGDLGWDSLVLGGHDPVGEAYQDFQRTVKALTNRGVLLAIVSKNEESVALDGINKNREMILQQDDFVGWRINWDDKAKNIAELASELNLGLQSFVFIDDNSFERSRVRESLPEVLVPEWPENPLLYKEALLGLRCFDVASLTGEDRNKTQLYQTERKRQSAKSEFESLDEWLMNIELTVAAEELGASDLQRATQLLNKTNQMNLSTRRMAEQQLWDWAADESNRAWIFRVRDRFGDYGLCGIASLEIDSDSGKIVDFILSCRVMGRKIEQAMLQWVVDQARKLNLSSVTARYQETAKNKPCLAFFEKSGFSFDEAMGTFSWDTKEDYGEAECVRVLDRCSS
jgi:FkbH-like protein